MDPEIYFPTLSGPETLVHLYRIIYFSVGGCENLVPRLVLRSRSRYRYFLVGAGGGIKVRLQLHLR